MVEVFIVFLILCLGGGVLILSGMDCTRVRKDLEERIAIIEEEILELRSQMSQVDREIEKIENDEEYDDRYAQGVCRAVARLSKSLKSLERRLAKKLGALGVSLRDE